MAHVSSTGPHSWISDAVYSTHQASNQLPALYKPYFKWLTVCKEPRITPKLELKVKNFYQNFISWTGPRLAKILNAGLILLVVIDAIGAMTADQPSLLSALGRYLCIGLFLWARSTLARRRDHRAYEIAALALVVGVIVSVSRIIEDHNIVLVVESTALLLQVLLLFNIEISEKIFRGSHFLDLNKRQVLWPLMVRFFVISTLILGFVSILEPKPDSWFDAIGMFLCAYAIFRVIVRAEGTAKHLKGFFMMVTIAGVLVSLQDILINKFSPSYFLVIVGALNWLLVVFNNDAFEKARST